MPAGVSENCSGGGMTRYGTGDGMGVDRKLLDEFVERGGLSRWDPVRCAEFQPLGGPCAG